MGNIVGSQFKTVYHGQDTWKFINRDPNQYDNQGYSILDYGQNTATKTVWQLVSLAGTSTSAGALATWVQVAGAGSNLETLTGNSGGAVSPTAGNINVIGDGTTINVVGNPGTSTLTISTVGTGVISTFTGDNAVAVSPIAGNINLIADTALLNCGSSVSILGNNSDATLSLNVTDSLDNTIIGQLAGKLGITGSENTSCGGSSLSSLTTGSNNTVLGYAAGAALSTGGNNILIGLDAGQDITTGSHNIILGNFAGSTTLTGNLVLGDSSITSAFIAGVYGTSLSGSSVVVTSSGQLGVGSGGGGTVTGFTTDDGHTVTPTAGVVIVAGGTGIVTTGTVGPNTITISATGITTLKYTNVNHAASPYTVLTTDEYLSVDCSGGVVSLLFPNAATLSRAWVVKDRTGNAATNNITVTTVGGTVNIDGATSFVLNTAYESINIIGNATSYEVY